MRTTNAEDKRSRTDRLRLMMKVPDKYEILGRVEQAASIFLMLCQRSPGAGILYWEFNKGRYVDLGASNHVFFFFSQPIAIDGTAIESSVFIPRQYSLKQSLDKEWP